ncbi:hypothetical protein FRB97_005529 [Tulasnella sp. 331]|nr:hypothetical protein FRB97_005529 [Tulasnella sp. 331]
MFSIIPNEILSLILELALVAENPPCTDLNVTKAFSKRTPLQYARSATKLSRVSRLWKDNISSIIKLKGMVGFGMKDTTVERFENELVRTSAVSSRLSVQMEHSDRQNDDLLCDVLKVIGTWLHKIQELDLRVLSLEMYEDALQDLADEAESEHHSSPEHALERARIHCSKGFVLAGESTQFLLGSLGRLDVFNVLWYGWDGWAIEDLRIGWGAAGVEWDWILRLFGPQKKLCRLRHLEVASHTPIKNSPELVPLEVPCLKTFRAALRGQDIGILLGLVRSKEVLSLDLDTPSWLETDLPWGATAFTSLVDNGNVVGSLTLRGGAWLNTSTVRDIDLFLRAVAPHLRSLTMADECLPTPSMLEWLPELKSLNSLTFKNTLLRTTAISDLSRSLSIHRSHILNFTLEIRDCRIRTSEGGSARKVMGACVAKIIWEGNEEIGLPELESFEI